MSDRSPIFMCGKAGGIFVSDEHSDAGHAHAEECNLRHFRKTGRHATLDRRVTWAIEGEEASRRRAKMRASVSGGGPSA